MIRTSTAVARLARKAFGLALIASAAALPAAAAFDVPEIDPSSVVGALALLSTGVAMIADRRKK